MKIVIEKEKTNKHWMNGFTINVCLWGLHGAIIQGRLVFWSFFLCGYLTELINFGPLLCGSGLCGFVCVVVASGPWWSGQCSHQHINLTGAQFRTWTPCDCWAKPQTPVLGSHAWSQGVMTFLSWQTIVDCMVSQSMSVGWAKNITKYYTT